MILLKRCGTINGFVNFVANNGLVYTANTTASKRLVLGVDKRMNRCPMRLEYPWLPMADAPKDGQTIRGKYGDDWDLVRWSEERRCMLAGYAGGSGYFGPGWEDLENGLIADEPEAWCDKDIPMTIEEANGPWSP